MDIHPIYDDVADLPALLARLAPDCPQVFVLADAGIPAEARRAFLAGVPESHIHRLPGGETVKTVAAIEGIWNFLLRMKADRKALLVNLGGGAVCDAGGFAASTFKRGIDFVHVPSTLLAMVDASVGGKTGINLGGVKNVVGTFTQPRAVCIHMPLLDSLPGRQRLSGYAEMIKHGLVADEGHLQAVLEAFGRGLIPSVQLIRDSVAIKAAIVQRDPLENGERKLLNFGHTVGHAIESYFADRPGQEVLHGEAIAAGMLAELYLSYWICQFPGAELQHWGPRLKPLTRHIHITPAMIPALLDKMGNDKKNESTGIGVTLLKAPGQGIWGKTVAPGLLKEALDILVNETAGNTPQP